MSAEKPFQALADPSRRKILRLLGDRELSAGEIGEHFEFSAPSLSHHLGVLREAGLIQSRKAGQQVLYSINTTVTQDLVAAVLDLFAQKPTQS